MSSAVTLYQPIRLPILQKEIVLEPCHKKTILVALAAIVFFGVQMGLCLASTIALTTLMGMATYLSEVHLRKNKPNQIDWLNQNFDWKKEALIALIFFSVRPFLMVFLVVALNLKLPLPPQKHLLDLLRANPLKMFMLGGVIAPIAEEILFRGFLLERLEDAVHLLKRFTPIRLADSKAAVAQAIFFGVIHVKKAMETADRVSTAIVISLMGFLFAKVKKSDRTLISPTALHAANNLSVITTFSLLDRYQCFR